MSTTLLVTLIFEILTSIFRPQRRLGCTWTQSYTGTSYALDDWQNRIFVASHSTEWGWPL